MPSLNIKKGTTLKKIPLKCTYGKYCITSHTFQLQFIIAVFNKLNDKLYPLQGQGPYILLHVDYIIGLMQSVIRVVGGKETSVLERSAAPPSRAAVYDHPDKQTAVNALNSRFKK